MNEILLFNFGEIVDGEINLMMNFKEK